MHPNQPTNILAETAKNISRVGRRVGRNFCNGCAILCVGHSERITSGEDGGRGGGIGKGDGIPAGERWQDVYSTTVRRLIREKVQSCRREASDLNVLDDSSVVKRSS